MIQKRQRLVTVITGYEPRRVDQVWPPIACEIAPPHAKLQATCLGARFSLPAAIAGGEIDAGTVTESCEPGRNGQLRCFVSFVDEEGGRLALWDGPTHAVAVASEGVCGFAAPIFDLSRSRHG